jgi:hypothetical protein
LGGTPVSTVQQLPNAQTYSSAKITTTASSDSVTTNTAITSGMIMMIGLPQYLVKLIETQFLSSGTSRSHLVHHPKESFTKAAQV